MANVYEKLLTKGTQASLALTPIEDGKLRYATDTGRCYLDFKDGNDALKRVRISDVEFDYTEAQILALTDYTQTLYIASDTAAAYVNVAGTWKMVGGVSLTQNSENKDYVIWFSAADGSNAMYNSGLTYNPSTDTISVGKLKVGNMLISETVNGEQHIVDFQIV